MENNVREFTMEEIYAAYLAASPEIQREVRQPGAWGLPSHLPVVPATRLEPKGH